MFTRKKAYVYGKKRGKRSPLQAEAFFFAFLPYITTIIATGAA
ncbi:hypothetical protein HMPREF3293_01586 [Christensenella minuta]|uniref:Uncharacterized protein n=1 Tax=Christensenella minuta TaxID=626937 RepID=A0A136Q458_9FIRM|nr:hypothetical protein HMPREF3293_01586 [Christensenella minuta]